MRGKRHALPVAVRQDRRDVLRVGFKVRGLFEVHQPTCGGLLTGLHRDCDCVPVKR